MTINLIFQIMPYQRQHDCALITVSVESIQLLATQRLGDDRLTQLLLLIHLCLLGATLSRDDISAATATTGHFHQHAGAFIHRHASILHLNLDEPL